MKYETQYTKIMKIRFEITRGRNFYTHCPWRHSIEKWNGHWLIIYVENQHGENLILNTHTHTYIFLKRRRNAELLFLAFVYKMYLSIPKRYIPCAKKLENAEMQVMKNLISCLSRTMQAFYIHISYRNFWTEIHSN